MKITEPVKGHPEFVFEYQDTDSFDNLEYEKCRQTYGVCFHHNQFVIGYGGQKNGWGLIGGTIEKGETFEQTLRREIQEESNMKIISFKPIGYQKVVNLKDQSFIYQLRYACIVEPIGKFESDPAGAITEIKLIDPKEYKKYFDWGQIGERIITRGTELVQEMKTVMWSSFGFSFSFLVPQFLFAVARVCFGSKTKLVLLFAQLLNPHRYLLRFPRCLPESRRRLFGFHQRPLGYLQHLPEFPRCLGSLCSPTFE